MESDKEIDIGDVQDFSEEILEDVGCKNIVENQLDLETDSESRDDTFNKGLYNLNLSLDILDTETGEVHTEFLEALTEIEGKKSFSCPKVCKSKGGLTKHRNPKHREADNEHYEESRLSFECLSGIVEAIKTSLTTDDLYQTELIDRR